MTATRRGVLLLGLAVLALSTAAPLIRGASPTPALAIAALRVTCAAVVLTVIARARGERVGALAHAGHARVIGSGVLLGIHFALWIGSLGLTSTAASVALVATNPVFAALLGRLVGDRVSAREWGGIVLAVVGCGVLAGGDWQAGGDALLGDGLALAGAACAAGYLMVGRAVGASIPLWAYLARVNTVAAVTLLLIAGVAGTSVAGLTAEALGFIVASALVASVLGHTLLNAAVRTTPTHLVALAILGEPVGATVLAWACFGEVPPQAAMIGASIALVGIVLGFSRRPG